MDVGTKRAREINLNPASRVYAVQTGDDRWKIVPRKRFFEAAKINRLTSDWLMTQASANEQLRGNLKALVARSRDLENNNEYVDGFLKQVERNVVGPAGILLRMQVYEPDGKGGWRVDGAAGAAIEDAWSEFGKRQNLLVTRDLCMEDMQRVVIRSIARDGAVVARKILGAQSGNRFGLALQLLEVDHLDQDLNTRASNGNQIVMGVEIDSFRRVVAYHLLTEHPGDITWMSGGRRYLRVPANEIIHPFSPTRIGQLRGLPWIASTMAGLRMLGGYKEAELVAARMAANQGGFFRDPSGTGNPYEADSEAEADPQSIQPMEPGLQQYIGNLEYVPHNPNHPVQAYGDFVNEVLRGFSTGLGVSHHNASGNMTQVNYSSARIAELAERDQWKLLQRWFADTFLQPLFEEWLFHSLMRGAIALPNGTALPASKFDKFNQPTWRGRRWQWVDPAKEVAAYERLLALNLTSRGRIITEAGADEEDIYEEIARSRELMAAKGINEPEPVDNENGGKPDDEPEDDDE